MLIRRESPMDYCQGYISASKSAQEIVRDELAKAAMLPATTAALLRILEELKKMHIAGDLSMRSLNAYTYETKGIEK